MRARLFIEATEAGVSALGLGAARNGRAPRPLTAARARRWKAAAENELRAYLDGKLRIFATPYDLRGLSPFTRAVLRVTAKIPYGEVRSYRWIAERLGMPEAARAVGNALARNPVPIIIPCHRVVRADGSVGGYALGPAWKKRLIELEKRI